MNWIDKHADVLETSLQNESVSGSLRQGLGQFALAEDVGSVGASKEQQALELAQQKLARSVNVLQNSADGRERSLSIGWSDGSKANTLSDDTIWLSPADVMKGGERKMDLTIDALTGQTLLASTMKRTVHPHSWDSATADHSPMSKPANIVWQAMETALARNEILDGWEGFAPYFARHEKANCASKKEVQEALNNLKPSLELAAAALAWDVLHPHDKLKLPAVYERGIKAALELLGNSSPNASDRYDFCKEACGLLEITPPPPPPPPPSNKSDDNEDKRDSEDESKGDGDNSDSDGEGEGGGEDSKPKDDESKESEPKGDDQEKEKDKQDEPKENKKDDKKDGDSEDGDDKDDGGDKSGKQPEQDGDDDGEGEGEGESEGEGEDEKPSGPAPKVNDGSLFGGKVEAGRTPPEKLPPPTKLAEEWDGHKVTMNDGLTKPNGFCTHRLFETDNTIYKSACLKLQTYIKAVSEALRFRNNDPTNHVRGVHSGDLDEGSLDKLTLHEENPAIWERRELHGQPKVAVGILLDESGSMGRTVAATDDTSAGGKMVEARRLTIILAEALSKVRGVSTMIIGHTTHESTNNKKTKENEGDYYSHAYYQYFPHTSGTLRVDTSNKMIGGKAADVSIFEYLTKQHANPWSLVHANARCSNADGHAMQYAVDKMLADYPNHQRRILFVISDGQPTNDGMWHDGSYYGGRPAMKHMRSVCEFARRKNLGVYGIGICNAYDNSDGEAMYGHGNFIVINNVMNSLPLMTAYIRNIAARPI